MDFTIGQRVMGYCTHCDPGCSVTGHIARIEGEKAWVTPDDELPCSVVLTPEEGYEIPFLLANLMPIEEDAHA